jgi:hypothetical protein
MVPAGLPHMSHFLIVLLHNIKKLNQSVHMKKLSPDNLLAFLQIKRTLVNWGFSRTLGRAPPNGFGEDGNWRRR